MGLVSGAFPWLQAIVKGLLLVDAFPGTLERQIDALLRVNEPGIPTSAAPNMS